MSKILQHPDCNWGRKLLVLNKVTVEHSETPLPNAVKAASQRETRSSWKQELFRKWAEMGVFPSPKEN